MNNNIKTQFKLDNQFTFACHKGMECYRSCCRDVTIFLSPYDVLRFKKALELTSKDLLEKYTNLVVIKGKQLPLVQLRMNKKDNKQCFFLREHGCQYYSHRPWACRMFPLDEYTSGGFKIIPSSKRCHGLTKGDLWTVKNWLIDQGATQSKEMDGSWDSLSGHHMMHGLDITNNQVQRMIITSLFDIDTFREFVFKSSFLNRFDLDQEIIDTCKTNDIALLDLGYAWVRFGLLGQKSLKLKNGANKIQVAKKNEK